MLNEKGFLGNTKSFTDLSKMNAASPKNFNAVVRSLFANGEQGLSYNINNLNTLFQDSAGTIHVTGIDQPVGLVLDQSGRGNHAFQPVASARPILRFDLSTATYYLEFDGVDQFLYTSTIDFTGIDQFSLFVGLRKANNNTTMLAVELSEISNNYPGTFSLAAPNWGNYDIYSWRARGTIDRVGEVFGDLTIKNNVVVVQSDISADYSSMRVDGTLRSEVIADQGDGNLGNHPLFIGRRGNGTYPWAGRLYDLTLTGRFTTDQETRKLERMLSKNNGTILV